MTTLKSLSQQINRISRPSIVSNLTIPLLALTDTAIAGHLGAIALGAIAIGGTIFNIIYNVFNFLRMGTGGFTSQAYGAGHQKETFRILVRAFSTGLLIGTILLISSPWLMNAMLSFMGASIEVTDTANTYIRILVFGAPAVLTTYAFTGWFLGMQDARTPMIVALSQNLTNILLSVILVFLFNMGIKGLAIGTLVAQYLGIVIYATQWWRHYHNTCNSADTLCALRHGKKRFFQVNRDFFLRTLCITGVQALFTSAGAREGNLTLAANALLMQFFFLLSYFMDGLAYAGEAIGGKYFGRRDKKGFSMLIRTLFKLGYKLALIFSTVYLLLGNTLLHLLTNDALVVEKAILFLPYICLMPIFATASFLYDGIFAGCTATRGMLLSVAIAAIIFITLRYALMPFIGNHGLWIAFLLFLLLRGIVEHIILRRHPFLIQK